MESLLAEAERISTGPRQQAYGHPSQDFARTAAMWSAITGASIKPEHVPLMMIALKISREVNRPSRDNLVDIAGYANTKWMMQQMF